MNKGAQKWVTDFKFRGLGIQPPKDNIAEYYSEADYFKYFMAPVCFIASGIAYDDYNWKLAEKGGFDAQDYLTNELPKLVIPNTIITFFNDHSEGCAWMFVLRAICKYMPVTKQVADLIPNLTKVWNDLQAKEIEVRYACFDVDGVDVPVYCKKGTDEPFGYVPDQRIIYPTDVRAKFGSKLVNNAVHKSYNMLGKGEFELVKAAVDNNLISKADLKKVRVPYITDDGKVEYKEVDALDYDKPSRDVMALFANLPKAMVDEAGDEIHALVMMVEDGMQVSDDVRQYVDSAKRKLVDDYDYSKPNWDSMKYADGDKTDGDYQWMDFDVLLEEYIKTFDISGECSINQLISYMRASDDSPTPSPVVHKATVGTVKDDIGKLVAITPDEEFNILRTEILKTFGVDTDQTQITAESIHNQLSAYSSIATDDERKTVALYAAETMLPLSVSEKIYDMIEGVEVEVTEDSALSVIDKLVSAQAFTDARQFLQGVLDKINGGVHKDNHYKVTTEAEEAGIRARLADAESKPSAMEPNELINETVRLIASLEEYDAVKVMARIMRSCQIECIRDALHESCSEEEIAHITPAKTEESFEEVVQRICDEDTAARLVLAFTSNSSYEPAKREYVDKFEEIGAYMLHEVRAEINRDPSVENRSTMTDILYRYFRIMMCDVAVDGETVLDEIEAKAKTAQPTGQRILMGALELAGRG